MPERRGVYFAFQGLLSAVLVLLFVQHPEREDWALQFPAVLGALFGSLVMLRLVSNEVLSSHWFQAGLFLSDVAISSLLLHWSGADSNLYLIYSLIIFGTAITRRLVPTLVVTGVTTALFLISGWHPVRGLPSRPEFWLQVVFLWIVTAILAILSQDAQSTQEDTDRRHQGRLIEIERLSTLGQIAAEVAHRIKGPLTTITVNAEVLAHKLAGSKDALKELREIRSEAQRCKDILKNLLDLGRIEEMDPRALDLREPLESAVKGVESQCEKNGIKLQYRAPKKPLMIVGDHSLLHEAIAAILQNAVEAGKARGKIHVALEAPEPGWWGNSGQPAYRLVVDDDGKGITSEDLDRIFKAYFTTKGKEGSGLGLSAALRIVQKHQGALEAFSGGLGKGARFILTIPRASPRLPG